MQLEPEAHLVPLDRVEEEQGRSTCTCARVVEVGRALWQRSNPGTETPEDLVRNEPAGLLKKLPQHRLYYRPSVPLTAEGIERRLELGSLRRVCASGLRFHILL